MMHQTMGLAHIFTASRINHNSASMHFNSLTVSDIQFKDKHFRDQNKPDGDLRAHLEKFLDPDKIRSGMINDLINATVCWIIIQMQMCPKFSQHVGFTVNVSWKSNKSLQMEVNHKSLVMLWKSFSC